MTVCGLPIHPLTIEQSVSVAEALIADGGPHQHVAVNAAKVVQAHDDPELARIIHACSLVNADGQSVIWAGRLLGHQLPERVAGIDFMLSLWRSAAHNGYRVYLLGAGQAVVERTARIAVQQGVDIVGYRDGYWDETEEPRVVATVREARPDILFVAVPSPRKEYFLARHQRDLGCALTVGVGGSFDVVTGLRSRAPRWMRRAGLEWLHRMVQEPRRMFVRYTVGNLRFAMLVLVHLARSRGCGPKLGWRGEHLITTGARRQKAGGGTPRGRDPVPEAAHRVDTDRWQAGQVGSDFVLP
ncbi:WecB/TagA/CpsF family glycosyltransferase [Streptomyces chiangmaiensis]